MRRRRGQWWGPALVALGRRQLAELAAIRALLVRAVRKLGQIEDHVEPRVPTSYHPYVSGQEIET